MTRWIHDPCGAISPDHMARHCGSSEFLHLRVRERVLLLMRGESVDRPRRSTATARSSGAVLCPVSFIATLCGTPARTRFRTRFGVGVAGGIGARSSVRSSLLLASEVIGGSDDCDAAKRIQSEEILVAGHDHVCTAVHGRFEKLVILRITRGANRLQYVDDFNERCDAFEKSGMPLPTHVAIELRRMQFLDLGRLR